MEKSRLPKTPARTTAVALGALCLSGDALCSDPGAGLPGRVIVAAAGHDLDQVLAETWREHFRYLGQRLEGSPGKPENRPKPETWQRNG